MPGWRFVELFSVFVESPAGAVTALVDNKQQLLIEQPTLSLAGVGRQHAAIPLHQPEIPVDDINRDAPRSGHPAADDALLAAHADRMTLGAINQDRAEASLCATRGMGAVNSAIVDIERPRDVILGQPVYKD